MTITPAIDLAKIKHLSGDDEGYFEYAIIPGDQDVQVVNGQVTVVGQTPDHILVENYYDDTIKGYDFGERFRELVDLARAGGAVVEGVFYGDGEESEDFWALRVENNVVSEESGQITYPGDLKEVKAQAWQEAHDLLCTLHGIQINCHTNPYRR